MRRPLTQLDYAFIPPLGYYWPTGHLNDSLTGNVYGGEPVGNEPPKEKPRHRGARGLGKVYRAWTEPAEARPAHLPARGRRQCDARGAAMRLSTRTMLALWPSMARRLMIRMRSVMPLA